MSRAAKSSRRGHPARRREEEVNVNSGIMMALGVTGTAARQHVLFRGLQAGPSPATEHENCQVKANNLLPDSFSDRGRVREFRAYPYRIEGGEEPHAVRRSARRARPSGMAEAGTRISRTCSRETAGREGGVFRPKSVPRRRSDPQAAFSALSSSVRA